MLGDDFKLLPNGNTLLRHEFIEMSTYFQYYLAPLHFYSNWLCKYLYVLIKPKTSVAF